MLEMTGRRKIFEVSLFTWVGMSKLLHPEPGIREKRFPTQRAPTVHPEEKRILSLIFEDMQSSLISQKKKKKPCEPTPEVPEWLKWDNMAGWQHETACEAV